MGRFRYETHDQSHGTANVCRCARLARPSSRPRRRPNLNPDAARVLARIIQRAAASARQDDPTDD